MILNLNEIQYEDMLNTNTALQYGSLGNVHKRNIALKMNLTYLHPLCDLYDPANSLKVQCFMVPIKICQVLLLSCHLQNIYIHTV